MKQDFNIDFDLAMGMTESADEEEAAFLIEKYRFWYHQIVEARKPRGRS
jgi:hypothetical protein